MHASGVGEPRIREVRLSGREASRCVGRVPGIDPRGWSSIQRLAVTLFSFGPSSLRGELGGGGAYVFGTGKIARYITGAIRGTHVGLPEFQRYPVPVSPGPMGSRSSLSLMGS
jgi:hypothetical protein